jgi:hypothetical protein
MIVEAIVAALAAGAASGATDAAKKAVVDSYTGLKSLIAKKFGHDSPAASVIKTLEVIPDSGDVKKALGKQLESVKADSDPELAKAAQDLLELIRALPQGEQHIQSVIGSHNVVTGRDSTVAVTYNAPVKKDE